MRNAVALHLGEQGLVDEVAAFNGQGCRLAGTQGAGLSGHGLRDIGGRGPILLHRAMRSFRPSLCLRREGLRGC